MRIRSLCCLLFLLQLALPAHALRPFDGTDAAVADDGEFELEFGPIGRLREGVQRTWLAPAFAANWGFAGDSELVFEGKRRSVDRSLTDVGFSLKHVLRRGVLQDAEGASLAGECGVLLPGIRAEHGTGASCALIASQRWRGVTVHFNSALAFSREHRWIPVLDAIAEGPAIGEVRPVMEVSVQKENGERKTTSALAGLTWKRDDRLTMDVGVRRAHGAGGAVTELRLGFTWTAPRSQRSIL